MGCRKSFRLVAAAAKRMCQKSEMTAEAQRFLRGMQRNFGGMLCAPLRLCGKMQAFGYTR